MIETTRIDTYLRKKQENEDLPIVKGAMLVTFSNHCIGTTRMLTAEEKETLLNPNSGVDSHYLAGGATTKSYKVLFEESLLKPIKDLQSKTYREFQRYGIQPWTEEGESETSGPKSRKGSSRTYICPIGMYQGAGKEMLPFKDWKKKRTAQLQHLARDFADNVYPSAVKEAQMKLGPIFNNNQYMESSEVYEAIYMTASARPIPKGSDFRLSLDVMSREDQDELAKELNNQVLKQQQKFQRDIVYSLSNFVKKFRDTLREKTNEGEWKGFHSTLITNMLNYAEDLEHIDFTHDPILKQIREEILIDLGEFGTLSAEEIKADETLREEKELQADKTLERIMQYHGAL